MVDVSAKPETDRVAAARGFVRMDEATLALRPFGRAAKGDVARIAELAGTMAAKRTGDLIPLCHPLPLTAVAVEGRAGRGPAGPRRHRRGRGRRAGPGSRWRR